MDPTSHKVEILQLCHVSPPLNSIPDTSLPLTFHDLPYLIRSPSQILLFFNLSSSTTQSDHFIDSILPRIKHSLSLTLQHFYPLAGNLSWSPDSGKPIISYTNGDSVPVTVAESINGDFAHLSSHNYRDPNDLKPLVPQLFSPTKQVPALAIQITLFPKSSPLGMSMAIVSNHAAMDGRAVALFISLWASICRLGGEYSSDLVKPESVPFYDRSVVKDPFGFEKLYLDALVKFVRSKSMSENDCNNWLLLAKNNISVPSDAVFATFELRQANIARLKQSVLAAQQFKKTNDHDEDQLELINPSRFELACGYTWLCLTKSNYKEIAANAAAAAAADDDDDEETYIYFAMDYRARSEPPIPATYFGNCVVTLRVSAKRREIMGEDGIVVAVKCIRKQICGLNEEVLKFCLENKISRLMSNGPERFRAIAGSPQFGFYKLDFGWGRPVKVDYASIALTGAIFFADSGKEDGGIEISLVRPKEKMDAFALWYTNGIRAEVGRGFRIKSRC